MPPGAPLAFKAAENIIICCGLGTFFAYSLGCGRAYSGVVLF